MNTIETANAHVDKFLKDNGLLIRGAKMMMVRKLMADSYLAGASAMNGSAGVWVKADVRLPEFKEREKPYVVRYMAQPENFELWKWDWINERQANSYPIEWLDTSVSSPSPQSVEEIVKQEKIKLIWEMIQAWQDSRDKDTDIDAQQYSAQDIEVDLYDWLEKVDPKAPAQKPPSPSPLEAETADKKVNNQIMKYRKLAVVIDAVKWDGKNFDEISNFTRYWHGHKVAYEDAEEVAIKTGVISIRTLEGDMKASKGDWIIKGVNGEFYPCKPDIFEKTYKPVQ